MANTKIPVELSSTPSIVDNGNSTAITIDSSENVGIGITNPSDYYSEQLVVNAEEGEGGITIKSATDTNAYLMFADGTVGNTAYRGYIMYAHSADEMRLYTSDYMNFYSNGSERMRIDSSGIVTTPNQPHVFGSLTNTTGSGSADTFTAHSSYSRNTITVSTVSSVKRFIAPVDGVYHMSFNTIMDLSYNTRHDTKIFINGVEVSQTLNETDTSGYKYRSQSVTVLLDANDYVTIYSPDWYDAATTTFSLWRTFSMVLLG